MSTFIKIGQLVSYASFFIFCGLFMLYSKDDRRLSELEIEYSSPANLRLTAESFRTSYAVELGAKAHGNIAEFASFQKLERRLSEYANHLEIMREQRLARKNLVLWLYLASAVLIFMFTAGLTLIKKKQVKGF